MNLRVGLKIGIGRDREKKAWGPWVGVVLGWGFWCGGLFCWGGGFLGFVLGGVWFGWLWLFCFGDFGGGGVGGVGVLLGGGGLGGGLECFEGGGLNWAGEGGCVLFGCVFAVWLVGFVVVFLGG